MSRGQAASRLRREDERRVGRRLEPGNSFAQDDVPSVEAEEVCDQPPILLVERRKHLIGHLGHGDVEVAVHEVLGRLEADEAPRTTTARHRARTV
jgi:hypothetical protein